MGIKSEDFVQIIWDSKTKPIKKKKHTGQASFGSIRNKVVNSYFNS